MKLIIDIPEKVYNAVTHIEFDASLVVNEMRKSIANGTPIHNVTNGDIVMAFFPNEHDFETDFDADWWNAPYQKGGKE